ncbi:NADPH-dependent 7-cyano-7-deazaguanine reductase QueF [Castellaniella daejeonensis]|uniref:NADPH-dependent 7-cyano-7-deazaguanine reductase n=1 Tax=Castellaniella daejeonensis TaxID=659013 RepID=A0ABN0TGA6_9BURK|nr:NADPH-dependent 7-cyano-7-deazaguanine reductase QueF [Castellaniella sp.]HET8703858.1 NADPH-dependent 7-cyano-7-deazaguanine reductase QueF [Castellaniella sp.]
MNPDTLSASPLGRSTPGSARYDPTLLFPIARVDTRAGLDLPQAAHGADIWNAYEMSWLSAKGKPVVAIGRFTVPMDSPCLIESKSLKLYLNSYNEERFEYADIVRQRLHTDLSRACGKPVHVEILSVRPAFELSCAPLRGTCIDDQDLEFEAVQTPQPDSLVLSEPAPFVREILVSELLKSNCPVTGQPDWASLQIRYAGPRIDHAGLLRYIVSLRRHQEFHELCVEKIYGEIMQRCAPEELLVYARYTRRGGLDINPWRASYQPTDIGQTRTLRQ